MEQFFLGIIALLLLLNLAVTLRLYCKLLLPDERERNERAVEQAMKESAADPMDEGFDNIMRFSVNGKTGFESE